jgi:serine/threonine-protein kinase RsbW
MERTFKKEIASLDEIFDFVKHCATTQEIDQTSEYSVALVIEEFFTNMVKYSPESRNDVTIGITKEARKLTVTLVDTDVEPFDVTDRPTVNTLASLEERKPGGLGIYISKELMDSVTYEYENRCSKITCVKTLEQ